MALLRHQRRVLAAMRAATPLRLGLKGALALHSVEHRIKRALADAIAMPRQFLDFPVPVQVALRGMMQDLKRMNPASSSRCFIC